MEKAFVGWMWSEACARLARAESLRREFYRPALSVSLPPTWEPPVDVLETENEVLVLLSLPGVNIDCIEAVIEGDDLLISGLRTWPLDLKTAIIHRLELPQGRFERRVRLPAAAYQRMQRFARDGYVMITLEKLR